MEPSNRSLPTYYAVIPANVRYDKKIPAGAKLMYGEISALSNAKGYCYASNGYFADLYGCTKQAISKWIRQLKDAGYVHVSYTGSKENRTRIVSISGKPTYQPQLTPLSTTVDPLSTTVDHNNTSNNNTSNNTPYNPPEGEGVSDPEKTNNKLQQSEAIVSKEQPAHDNEDPPVAADPPNPKMEGFSFFWEAYGYKVGIQAAKKAWMKKSMDEKRKAYSKISEYDNYLEKSGISKLHASTYLNQSRYDDDFESAIKNIPASRQPKSEPPAVKYEKPKKVYSNTRNNLSSIINKSI